MFVGGRQVWIFRVGWRPREESVFIQVWRRSTSRALSSWGMLVFSLKVFNWWDKAYHFSEGNQLYLNTKDLNVTHIFKNTLSSARPLIDQN